MGSLVIGLFGLGAGLAAYLLPPERRAFNPGHLRAPVARAEGIPLGGGKLLQFQGKPVWVLHLRSGFVAYSAISTHQGCIVDWEEGRRLFVSPCHGGLFDSHGNVVTGLPQRPLPRLRAEVIRGEVFIAEEGYP